MVSDMTMEEPRAGIVDAHVGHLGCCGQQVEHVGIRTTIDLNDATVPVGRVYIDFRAESDEIPAHPLSNSQGWSRQVAEDITVDRVLQVGFFVPFSSEAIFVEHQKEEGD